MRRRLGAVLLGLVALPPPAAEGQAVGPAFQATVEGKPFLLGGDIILGVQKD